MITENQDIYCYFIEDMNLDDNFDIIKQHSRNYESLATNINNMIMLANGSIFGIKLNEIWNEYCEEHQICSTCGGEIHIENRYRVCENCG